MSGVRGGAAILVPVVLAAGLVFAGWIALRRRAEAELALPRLGAAAPSTIEGWSGGVPEIAGLQVRLASLHAEPRRQAFETSALRARFGRAEGEPFRLEFLLAEDARPVQVDLASCTVIDARGAALDVLQRASDLERSATLPADPLRALFAAGPIELVAGATVSVVLFGRVPAAGVRLVTAELGEIALTPDQWTSDPLEDVLARRPAPTPEEAGR